MSHVRLPQTGPPLLLEDDDDELLLDDDELPLDDDDDELLLDDELPPDEDELLLDEDELLLDDDEDELLLDDDELPPDEDELLLDDDELPLDAALPSPPAPLEELFGAPPSPPRFWSSARSPMTPVQAPSAIASAVAAARRNVFRCMRPIVQQDDFMVSQGKGRIPMASRGSSYHRID